MASVAGAAQIWSARKLPLPAYGGVPDFQLSDEQGQLFRHQDLVGHVSVVDFIFTSCSSACPLLSAEMGRLQAELVSRGLADRVRLVSVSVDPARDTVGRLRAYAAREGARPGLWRFVRGDESSLRGVVVDGLKQVMDKQADKSEVDGFTILHGTRFVLLDDTATIRGFYDANDAASMHALRDAIAALADHRVRLADAP